MSLNHREIARVVAELAPRLVGAKVQKARQPRPEVVLLECRAPGRTETWLFSFERGRTRLHATARRFPQGDAAPPFCMLLRKHLVGTRIGEVIQRPGDRVVEITFRRGVSGSAEAYLVAELFDRGGNLLLLDPERRVLGGLKPIPPGRRGLAVGAAYTPPEPPPPGRPVGLREFAEYAGDYSDRVDAHYAHQEAADALAQKKARVLQTIRAERKRLLRYVEEAARERERLGDHETLRRRGELLKAHLHALPGRAAEVTVEDFGGGAVTIPLDPSRSVAENADRLFKLARKHRLGLERLEANDAGNRLRLGELDELERQTAAATEEAALDSLAARACLRASARKQTTAAGPRRARPVPSGPRRFWTGDGLEVLVGRNDEENDQITFRVARGGDYFFHARGLPGSHVILRLPRNATLTQTALLDAAHLAVFYSKARGAGVAEVSYTPVKNVRKPRGAPPGMVAVSGEKTIRVRVERERLDRLFASREVHGDGTEPPAPLD